MKNKLQYFVFKVSSVDVNKRIDSILSTKEELHSRSQAQKLFLLNHVLVNEKIVKPSYKVQENDLIKVVLPKPKPSELSPWNYKLDIFFEDDDLIVLNKPSGLVVHPSAGHAEKTLVHALLNHTDQLSMGFGEHRPGIVHRLDKDTSGLIVIAKNNTAHTHLAQQFKNKTTQRAYWAICFGQPSSPTGTFKSYLARHPKKRKIWSSTVNEQKGKLAITHYELIKAEKGVSLIKLKLETGRTHQIRVHLSENHLPIVADWTYASTRRLNSLKSLKLAKEIKSLNRFALHAYNLGFSHPKNDKKMFFKAPIPENLKSISELLNIKKDIENL